MEELNGLRRLLEKFSLDFSSSLFLNPCQSCPSLFHYGLLSSLWCFSILVNYTISGFFQLKGNSMWGQNNSKDLD